MGGSARCCARRDESGCRQHASDAVGSAILGDVDTFSKHVARLEHAGGQVGDDAVRSKMVRAPRCRNHAATSRQRQHAHRGVYLSITKNTGTGIGALPTNLRTSSTVSSSSRSPHPATATHRRDAVGRDRGRIARGASLRRAQTGRCGANRQEWSAEHPPHARLDDGAAADRGAVRGRSAGQGGARRTGSGVGRDTLFRTFGRSIRDHRYAATHLQFLVGGAAGGHPAGRHRPHAWQTVAHRARQAPADAGDAGGGGAGARATDGHPSGWRRCGAAVTLAHRRVRRTVRTGHRSQNAAAWVLHRAAGDAPRGQGGQGRDHVTLSGAGGGRQPRRRRRLRSRPRREHHRGHRARHPSCPPHRHPRAAVSAAHRAA
eukprot:ctg_1172.g371